MDKCAVFVANYRGLDRYYNFIFAGRKILREEYFAGGKFREIPFAVDINFAGGKFRAKSKFANIAKISSTRKIGVIQYIVLSNKMLSKIVQSCCLQSLCCNNEYTPSWHLSTFDKMRGFIDIWCFARLSSHAPRSWREFAKCRFTHFPSIF